jgi:hypothetical protein
MAFNSAVTIERLKEVLSYDPATGLFVWKISLGWKGAVGKEAGTPHQRGYISIMIDQKLYLAHRLAWFYITGQWPKNRVDHKDCDRANNRFENLREATNSQNNQNRRKRAGCRSRFKGVSWHVRDRMWEARIKLNRETIRLGLYKTEEDAHAAYCDAARKMFGDYARAA